MYTLYYSPGRASMAVHWMLIELGVPFEARLVDFETKAHKDPEYLRLNPDGMIPTLVVDGKPRFESAALALMLAERHPEGGLEVPRGRAGAAGLSAMDALFRRHAAAALSRLVLYRRSRGS